MVPVPIIDQNKQAHSYTHLQVEVLDGRNEIILANWPNNKHIRCNINNDIPVTLPSFPYVLVNRSVLCNCKIEVENHFLLESLAACHNAECILVMYFMVNSAFVNYLNSLANSKILTFVELDYA